MNVKKKRLYERSLQTKPKIRAEIFRDLRKVIRKSWKQNAPQKVKFSYKEQREFETIDDDIAALEERIEKIKMQINANVTNSVN